MVKFWIFFFQTFIWVSSSSQSGDELIPYKKGKLWGFCDTEKNIIIQPKYSYVDCFSNGIALVGSYKNSGLIDARGNIILDTIYNDLSTIYCLNGVVSALAEPGINFNRHEKKDAYTHIEILEVDTTLLGEVVQKNKSLVYDKDGIKMHEGYLDKFYFDKTKPFNIGNFGMNWFIFDNNSSRNLGVFDTLEFATCNILQTLVNGKYGLLKTNGQVIIDSYDKKIDVEEIIYFGVDRNYLYKLRYLDSLGIWRILDFISFSSKYNYNCPVLSEEDNKNNSKQKEENQQIIDANLKRLSEVYEDVIYVCKDIYSFKKDNKFGLVNSKNDLLIKPIYYRHLHRSRLYSHYITPIELYLVQYGENYSDTGYINIKGDEYFEK